MRNQVDHKNRTASPVELLVFSTNVAHEEVFHKTHGTANVKGSSIDNNSKKETGIPQSVQPVTQQFIELVSIFPKVSSVFKKAVVALQPRSVRFETQLRPLRVEAFALRSELLAWSMSQPAEVRPTAVRRFTQSYTVSFPDCRQLVFPTLRADSYPDCKSSSRSILHVDQLHC